MIAQITPQVLLRGIHLSLTDAMRASIEAKAARLIRHEPRLLRIRIDVEDQRRGSTPWFVAKGYLEVQGPDRFASVGSDDAYKSVDLLIDKLDRQLRKRATAHRRARASGDIRRHVAPELVG
jgi:putative sigma-54 modulation protein